METGLEATKKITVSSDEHTPLVDAVIAENER